jgi:sugar phosphate isomerase/epimerase
MNLPIQTVLTFLLALPILAPAQDIPENLKVENLAAWCIVPFDAKKRGPEERAKMLVELGIKRSAYDWRANHVAEFEEEILQYQKHGIEFFAFWSSHPEAFALFEKYDLHPQIWHTLGSPSEGTQQEKVSAAADSLEMLAQRTAGLGCKLALYNHGGWGGEPANLVAVCQKLQQRGHDHVGIVYNWHHGHGHIEEWAQSLELMKPYLHCLNLNGMNDGAKPKILSLGHGKHDASMLKTLIKSGYDGPVGILDHMENVDAAEALQANRDGLQWLLSGGKGEKPKPAGASLSAPPVMTSSISKPILIEGPTGFGKALAGGAVIEANQGWQEPPITVEFQVKLENPSGFNIFVASETKDTNAHWELFGWNGNGKLTLYLPGATPDHVRSDFVISDGQWHAVAMQYGLDRVRLFVDGQQVADQEISLKKPRKGGEGGLAFGRLVSGRLGHQGAIDEVRIRKGIHEPGTDDGELLGEWNFEDLTKLKLVSSVPPSDSEPPENEGHPFTKEGRAPLEREADSYWQHEINRDRVYDFYAKQALARSENLVAFPGLDGGHQGHWGNQNDETTWKDGRVGEMDHGSMASGVFRGKGLTIARAVSVRLGGGLNVVFDTDACRFAAAWRGDLVKWSNVRRGLMHGIPMGGDPVELSVMDPPGANARFLGIHRSGDRVVFSWAEGDQVRCRSAVCKDGGVVEVDCENSSDPAAQWPAQIVTQGQLGHGHPYAIDTLTLPLENPYRALFFTSDVDFLGPNRIAICNMHGDVWICDATDNLAELKWKRFAAGLHQPLGLKVVEGVIHVMCRDGILALHDRNGDDEADFYESVSRSQVTSSGGHDFITGLQRDASGRWFFASGNQGICRVNGDQLEVLATGLRNPNGLGISPDGGVVLSSVQEGNWTPASAICDVSLGGHFGAGGPRDGQRGYVPPMLYLPRGVDNSSGGQTFIDSVRWGPVRGQWIHYSGGYAKHFLVLREQIEASPGAQALAVVLPGSFLSGAHRGRFSAYDGQLYVAGAQGWGNYSVADGSLQRVRYTGGEQRYPYPIAFETRANGLLLTFSQGVSENLADAKKWFAQHWNYRYGPAYGSAEFSVANPAQTGHDRLDIRGAYRVGEDGKQLFLEIPQLRPVNQLHLHLDAQPRLELFATLHELGESFTEFPNYEPIEKTFGLAQQTVQNVSSSKDPAVLMTACAACHHPTKQVVGPPLADIRKRYAKNPQGIVNWAMQPENKNPQLPPMPSFSFLGEEKLRIIADAILSPPE